MAKSIMQEEKCCCICGTTQNLHEHHVIYGTANRKMSEKYGLKVWLCQEHHTGENGVHHNPYLDDELKKQAEIKWLLDDDTRSIRDFRIIFGKNYL